MPTVTVESRRTSPDDTETPRGHRPGVVLIVHSDELILLGAQAALRDQPWMARCELARSADEAVRIAERERPQVAVVRGCAPDGGAALAVRLRVAVDGVHVVTFGEARAREFIEIVRAAVAGDASGEAYPRTGPAVSAREVEVLQYLATGASNGEIGTRLFLSPHTVKQHVRRICHKLGARNRVDAVSKARAIGVLD